MTGRGLNVKMLDLEAMNQNIFTLETLWFSIMAHNPPLNRYLDDTIRQYAFLLQRITMDTIYYMLRMNNVDFNIYPNVEGLIAAKKPSL